MRKLVLGCFVAIVASQAAGCIITSDDDDPPIEEIGLITAEWNFKELATNTIVTQCPPGFDTASVHSKRLDVTQADIIDLYDCAALEGTPPQGYPAGVYEVFVQIENDSGTNVYGQSLPVEVDITTVDKTFQTTLLDDGGYFAIAWDLVDAVSNAPLSCAAAGNPDAIEIISTVTGGSAAVSDKFNCEDGGGVTAGLLAGSYTTSVSAINAAGQALGEPQNAANQVIGDRNAVTNLGTVTLPID